jgi:hypothetical protein
MEPCKQGYPCSYASQEGDHCLLPRCTLKHVTIPGKEGEYAYDSLSGRLTKWVTVERKEPRPVDYLWDGVEPVRDGARKIIRG